MVESFPDVIKSLSDRSNVRTLSLAELDQETHPFGRPTQNGSLSFYSNVPNQSAGLSVGFGSDRVASTGLSERQRSIRDGKDDTPMVVRSYLERAPLVRVQRTIGDNPGCNAKRPCSYRSGEATTLDRPTSGAIPCGTTIPPLPAPIWSRSVFLKAYD